MSTVPATRDGGCIDRIEAELGIPSNDHASVASPGVRSELRLSVDLAATDLRLFAAWCGEADVPLFGVRRAHLELFDPWIEENGKVRSTVATPVRPGQLLPLLRAGRTDRAQPGGQRPPAEGRLRVPHPSSWTATSWTPSWSKPASALPATMPWPCCWPSNDLRISEAPGADIDDLKYERGHRTLKILRKGGKSAVMPLALRTSRAVDLYIGERTTGPIFLAAKVRGGTSSYRCLVRHRLVTERA
jgi:integrase/recombinase XerD